MSDISSGSEFFKVLLIISLISYSFAATINQLLDSPCPDNFQYQYDENGALFGRIQIDNPNSNKIQMNVELSVGNNVEGYNGNIQLVSSKEKVVDDIMHRRPILYNVFFPAWTNIPPKITKIFVNGELVCRGPKISMRLVPILTTINLQHTLKVDVQPLSSSPEASVPGRSPQNDFDLPPPRQKRPPSFDINFIPPEEDIPNTRINGNPKRPPNNFDFNPVAPTNGHSQNNNINFSPKMPKNPSRIYPGNPFFSSVSTTDNPTKDDLPIGSDLSGSSSLQSNPFFNSRVSERPPNPRPVPVTETPVTVQRNDPDRKDSSPFDVEFPVKKDVEVVVKDKRTSGRPYENVCGRTVTTNSLVVNGNEVPRGAYPWLSALFGVKATGLTYMCSGSLISDRHVVTAAHCVKKDNKKLRPSDLLIILGKLNIQKWVPGNGEKMIEPETIDIHPDYEAMSSDADIAVLTLSESVQFTKYIRPLCIWNGDTRLNSVVGKEGTVVGWGKDENGDVMTAEPKQISLPIVSQEQCLRSSYQFQYITSNRTFCAGFRNGAGPCNGDSGSGFLMQRDGRFMLRGIVSMSISETHTRTCDLSNYVVFTDASKYSDWLLSFIK